MNLITNYSAINLLIYAIDYDLLYTRTCASKITMSDLFFNINQPLLSDSYIS